MTFILNRISYADEEPCLPLIDTEAGPIDSVPLEAGETLPNMGVWFDTRYCTCGARLDPSDLEESSQAEIVIKTMCSECASRDFLNTCRIVGVKRPTGLQTVRCDGCFKYLTECSEGYCVYLAILTEDPSEVKVGTTKIKRIETRINEGGYAAMSLILPQEKSSFSLPEADYIEKNVLDGISLIHNSHILKIAQRFYRDIGFVGKTETKRNTLRALGLQPSEQLKNECRVIAEQAIKVSNNARMNSVPSRLRLEIEQTYLNENQIIDLSALQRIDEDCLYGLDVHVIKGRKYRELPAHTRVVAVKGSCVVYEDLDNHLFHSVVFGRNYQGREIFDPVKFLPNRHNSDLTQWMGVST